MMVCILSLDKLYDINLFIIVYNVQRIAFQYRELFTPPTCVLGLSGYYRVSRRQI